MSSLATLDSQIAAIHVNGGTPEALFEAIRGPVEHFLLNPAIDLGAYRSRSDNPYARYLVSNPDLPIQLVLAVWHPGTGSPIHDHQGLTGAVGLLAGELVETKYELRPRDGGFEVAWQGGGKMQPGLASPIYPAGLHQTHRMYNAGASVASTLHVYLGRLTCVTRYVPGEAGVLISEKRDLWFDE